MYKLPSNIFFTSRVKINLPEEGISSVSANSFRKVLLYIFCYCLFFVIPITIGAIYISSYFKPTEILVIPIGPAADLCTVNSLIQFDLSTDTNELVMNSTRHTQADLDMDGWNVVLMVTTVVLLVLFLTSFLAQKIRKLREENLAVPPPPIPTPTTAPILLHVPSIKHTFPMPPVSRMSLPDPFSITYRHQMEGS